MEKAYLEGVEKLGNLPIKGFNVDSLKEDVEEIFSRDEWYEAVLAQE